MQDIAGGSVKKSWQWSGRQLTLRSKRRPHYEWSRWTNHCWKPLEHSYNTDQGRRPFQSCKYKLPQKILSTLKLFSDKVRLSAISKWVKEPHCYLTLLSPKVLWMHFIFFDTHPSMWPDSKSLCGESSISVKQIPCQQYFFRWPKYHDWASILWTSGV